MKKHLEAAINPAMIVVGAVLLRLIPHVPNFAPIGAIGLFGGVYLNKKYAVLVLFAALVISDYLLLYVNPFSPSPIDFSRIYSPLSLVHTTTVFVYLSFFIYFMIGKWIARNKNFGTVVFGSLVGSILFFLITNFGVWAVGMYSRSLDGLITSYIMGLPFFRGTLFGDLFYTAVFFGGYELVLQLVKKPEVALAEK